MNTSPVNCGFLYLMLVVLSTSSYRLYQGRIPNGARVLDPCNTQAKWVGVGHQSREGGNARNPFGQDFSVHGHKWTKELCQLDSDGDGLSNGAELGDPDCSWKPGDEVKNSAKSHPGICEPLSRPACEVRNSWLDCSQEKTLDKVMCPSIHTNSTFSRDLRLKPTAVPALETAYYCQMFDLDVTSDLHMIATQPLISAPEVVHHILLFGCDPKEVIEPELRSPYKCVMVPHEFCRSLIGAWTVGSPGECAHPDMGFRMGPKGYKTVAIQVHWNNPEFLEGIVDNSGLRIHLTSSLRSNDAGMLVVGQLYLQVNPESEEDTVEDVAFSSSCPARCTKAMFKTPVFITSAVNHMHYLGRAQKITVHQNNTLSTVITDQDNYNYDDPLIYTFSEPIKINPGDEIRTTCVYKRPTSNSPVCWGEATSEEMCFGFITYYPIQSLTHPWCTAMKEFQSCDRHLPALSNVPVDNCLWWNFRNTSHPDTRKFMGRIFDKCYSGKSGNLTCTEECQEAARTIADHPCIKGEVGSYMIDKMKQTGAGHLLLDAVITCSCQKFSYCDRKTAHKMLGNRQPEFCPKVSRGTHPWLESSLIIAWLRVILPQIVGFVVASLM